MIKEAIKKAMFSSAWILHLIKGDISNMFVCLLLVFKVAVLRGAFVSAVFHCTGRTIMSWQMKRLLKKATCSFAWNLFKHHHAIARRRKYKSYRDIIPKSKCPFYIQIIKLNVKSSRLLLHCKEYIVQRKLICIHELEMIYNLFNRHCYPQLSCSTPTAWHWYPDGSPTQSLWSLQSPWQQEPRRLPPCPRASLRCVSSTPSWMPGARMIKGDELMMVSVMMMRW